MNHLPLPSLVHYELLLQLLERKSLVMTYEQPALYKQIQQLIVTLRKAKAQQKQLEAICEQIDIPFEHHWSLNSIDVQLSPISDKLTNQSLEKK
ncbi:MAG TPA: hypothetical protein DCF68_13245 [Cyanothece sp. UBA12306]|nr:hypothetical protein [Cyanothece sp. UBA12306]